MQESDLDLARIARTSRLLTVSFWFTAPLAAGVLGYVLVYWLPAHTGH